MTAIVLPEASRLFPWVTRDEVFRIETPRLWLRWSRTSDAPVLQRIASHGCVAEMTATWPHPLPDGEAAERIVSGRAVNAVGHAPILALTRKGDPDRLIGQVGCNALSAGHPGIGYLLDPAFAGQGLMSEAVREFVRALFTYTRFARIAAASRTINPASRRVLEKCGFDYQRTGSHEAKARGMIEVDYFELSRDEWQRSLVSRRRALREPPMNGASTGCDISEAAGNEVLL